MSSDRTLSLSIRDEERKKLRETEMLKRIKVLPYTIVGEIEVKDRVDLLKECLVIGIDEAAVE